MNRRLFISISLPPAWLDLFFQRVIPAMAGIRWIEKGNIHVTVHFMGSIPEQEIVNIRKKLEGISAEIPPFTLEFSKIDFAPPGKTKRMIWAYFSPSKNFEDLVQKIKITIGGKGAEEERLPLPHATLARFKDLHSVRGLKLETPAISDKVLMINSFELQESELLPSGARYHVLHSFPLKGSS